MAMMNGSLQAGGAVTDPSHHQQQHHQQQQHQQQLQHQQQQQHHHSHSRPPSVGPHYAPPAPSPPPSSNNNNSSNSGDSQQPVHHYSHRTGTGGGGGPQQPQQPPRNSGLTSLWRTACQVGYDSGWEQLEYDYTYDPAQNGGRSQKPIRMRERGELYLDSYNDAPWPCSFGTKEENGIWMNSSDQAGTIMAALVWLLMLYSCVTVVLLTITEGIHPILGILYCCLNSLALAAHAKTSLTDPGSVPRSAVPCEQQRQTQQSHSMCGQCQTFKPPMSHHCRICNRCVSRMDHHCPWMNNCVGAANLKHFCLFLIYTWTCSAYALLLFGWNYFLCAEESCTFHPIVVHLVRIMTILCIGAFLFTSSMLMNVTYGLMTGIGTIDRLKKKATNTMSSSDEEPIALKDVFGVGGYHTWWLPMDPVFDNYDAVMGYSMPQRLAREQQLLENQVPPTQPDSLEPSPTVELPSCVNDMLPV